MKFSKHEQRVIKEIFKKAYDDKETALVGDHWQPNVMMRIRNLEPIASGKLFFIGFEQFLWRLAPAACLMIIVLTIILYKLEMLPDYSVFQVLMNGEEELTISQLMGV